MNIEDYAREIELFSRFTAEKSEDKGALERAVANAVGDSGLQDFIEQNPPPDSKMALRQWLTAAITLRSPGDISEDFLTTIDQLLQSELADKQLVSADSLPRLEGSHPASRKISIWNGDISTLKVDAITNAANNQLLGCFIPFHACIDNVIHNAAGPRLREDCHRILALQGSLEKTSVAKVTRGYNLPSRFVVHTVGPIVPAGMQPTAQHAKQLASCYKAVLSAAKQARAKSVALCCISTGVFGYPQASASLVAINAVVEWLNSNPDGMNHVIFNTFGEEATQIYQSTWHALKI